MTKENRQKIINKRLLTCDEVAWIKDVFKRYGNHVKIPKPSIAKREDDAMLLASLLEIMEILNLDFKDRSARYNAISQFSELYTKSSSECPVDLIK